MDEKHNDEVILAELKGLKELVQLRFTNLEDQGRDFGKRITIVELWQSNTVGKISIISIAIGIAVSVLVAWVSHHI